MIPLRAIPRVGMLESTENVDGLSFFYLGAGDILAWTPADDPYKYTTSVIFKHPWQRPDEIYGCMPSDKGGHYIFAQRGSCRSS